MLEIYIIAGVSLLIIGLFTWGKYQAIQIKAERSARQAAEQRIDIAEQSVVKQEKVAGAVITVQHERADKQRVEQVQIDAGNRDHFDSDGF